MEETIVTIRSVNISREKGTVKEPVEEAFIDELGLQGDAHAGPWHRQVSLIALQSLENFYQQTGRKINPGEFAENLTIDGMDLTRVHLLDRFVGESVELEVTQIGKKCHGDNCAIFKEVGKCAMPEEGIFTRVVNKGKIKVGDQLIYRPKVFKGLVITLSDRASSGQYPDKSGEMIETRLKGFFQEHFSHYSVERKIIPDEQHELINLLQEAKTQGYDVVMTTGGTGLGSRDIAPETIGMLLDKEIPGIMEMVRMQFGRDNPNALLSRSMAGVMNKTLVYALPGSSRAVEEYLEVILPTLKHSFYMLNDLDVHG
ncbi:MAG: molybdenum cofactor synthesis domain-containing protein [Bacteroidota bacterium]